MVKFHWVSISDSIKMKGNGLNVKLLGSRVAELRPLHVVWNRLQGLLWVSVHVHILTDRKRTDPY